MFEEKLILGSRMRDSCLIQRLHSPSKLSIGGKVIDNPFSFGGGLLNGGFSVEGMNLLRSIFSFDYMGSAEFEWGAVPNCISFLAEQAVKGEVVANQIFLGKNNDIVFYVCPTTYENEVKKRIEKLYQGEQKQGCIQLKEYCGLHDYFFAGDKYSQRNLGWLELDNGFAFFVDKDMFEKFCVVFGLKNV
jgi:hypothetical protein